VDVVADPKFSRDRGFYEASFDVTITCATPGATIFYTVDGSDPAPISGRISTGSVYSGPIRIARTTCLRVRAARNGWLSSNAGTQTYIFLSDAIPRTQAEVLARGYPSTWFGGYPADYEMDPQIYADPAYAGQMNDAMLAIPTLSLVTYKDNFFSSTNNAETGGSSCPRGGQLPLPPSKGRRREALPPTVLGLGQPRLSPSLKMPQSEPAPCR
jgi:hypothetical protein